MTTMIGVELLGRRVLVVGGGAVSARRARGFIEDGAVVVVAAPELVADFTAMLEGGLVSWLPRHVQEADLADAWFVHTATGDPETDLRVAGWADALRLWCVNAGDASLGNARTPRGAHRWRGTRRRRLDRGLRRPAPQRRDRYAARGEAD